MRCAFVTGVQRVLFRSCKQAIGHVFTPRVTKAKSLLERGLVRKCTGCSLHPSFRTVRRLVRFGSECSCVLYSRERVAVIHAFVAIPQPNMSDGRRSPFIQYIGERRVGKECVSTWLSRWLT